MCATPCATPHWTLTLLDVASIEAHTLTMLAVRSLRRVAGSCVRRSQSVRALSGESHSDFGAIKKDVPEGMEEVPKLQLTPLRPPSQSVVPTTAH